MQSHFLSDLQISVLRHLHISRSAIGQQEEPALSHGDFPHAATRLDWGGQLEDALAGLDVLQDRWGQAHLEWSEIGFTHIFTNSLHKHHRALKH